MRLPRGPVVAILALAFALRLGAVLTLKPAHYPDTEQFLGLALNMVAGRGFQFNGTFEVARPPGYPAFLALSIGAFGESTRAVQIAQAGLDVLATWMVMVLAVRLGARPRGALGAGFLWAVNPFAIYFAHLVLSECLAGVLGLAVLCVWAGLLADPRALAAAGAGLLFAAAALTRASTLGLVAIAAAVLVAWGAGPLRRRLVAAAVTVATMALALVPWAARNVQVYGEFVLVAPLGGMTLYDSFNPYADGGIRTRELEWPRASNLAEADRKQRDLAIAWATAHPVESLLLAVEKQKRFWSPVPNLEQFRRMPYLLVVVYELPLLALGLAGAVMAVRRRWPAARLVPILVYFPLLHTVYLGSLRYRMPIEPLLALFAAMALDELLSRSTPSAAS